MRIKMLLVGIAFFSMVSTAQAAFDLKNNMLKLDAELGEVRQGFIHNDKDRMMDALRRLSGDAHDLLSNKSKIEALLPTGKRHKSGMAVNAARKIAENIQVIEDAIIYNKRNQSMVKRQTAAQRAYTYIEMACFHCHNLVRDQK